jgi:hypothetical protein
MGHKVKAGEGALGDWRSTGLGNGDKRTQNVLRELPDGMTA